MSWQRDFDGLRIRITADVGLSGGWFLLAMDDGWGEYEFQLKLDQLHRIADALQEYVDDHT